MLELTKVQAGYGRSEILHGISLRVGEGEIVSLIGSNGAGKSTTLRTISGLLAVRQGIIRFKGETLSNKPPYAVVRTGISHVPEGRRLFGDMSVRENLLLGGYSGPRAELGQRLERVYTMFPRLRERNAQAAGSLSGGEQQMAAIGRGLMAQPALLMLDEPSMGLAPKMVAQVADMVRSIRGLGISILLVEQNASIALELADRTYVLQMGKVVKVGTSAELREDSYVRRAYLGI
jgi:branched-chain amino acid transport system ATP-binding protein